jgi:membrane-associated phospholipid phosphatase
MRAPRRLLAFVSVQLALLAASSTSRAADPPKSSAADPPPSVSAGLPTSGPVPSPSAPADRPAAKPKLRWNDEWPRFRPVEFVLTGEVGPAAIAEYWLAPPQPYPHWTQTNPFDEGIRNALRLRSPQALRASWTTASMVDVALVVGTVGIDSIAVPFLRGNTDVGVQLGLMDAESFAVSSVVVISLYDTVGRARPSYEDCQRNPNFDADCRVSPTASFPSGHVNEAFTVAGLSCAQHTHLSLYGSRLLDVLACARDVALATTDGVLRIMGDRHYATDVLAGGALGFAWGYGLPMLLHYGRRDGSPSPTWSLAPLAGGGRTGLVLVGIL